LETKINVKNESENEIEFVLTYDEIKEDLEVEIAKQIKKIEIKGFRKGKAPESVVKKIYGDSLEYSAAEKVANNRFFDYTKGNHVHIIGEPVMTDIDFKPGSNLKFKIQYEVFPKLTNLKYKGLEIEVPDFVLKDEEVDREIQNILNSNAQYVDAETVENENFLITADLQRVDEQGNIIIGIKQDGMKINLADKNVHPDIVSGALNKKVGDTFSFSFEDQHKHADGEEHHEKMYYKITLKEIKKIALPELNDEFVKKVTRNKIATVAELKENIRKDLQNYYDNTIQQMTDLKLEKAILDNNQFTPPKSLIEHYIEHFIKEEIEYAKKSNRKIQNDDELRKKSESKAEHTVKFWLLKDKIMKDENITLTDEKIKEIAEKNSEKMGVTVDTLMKHYQDKEMQERLLTDVFYEFLAKNNTIKKINSEQYLKKEEVNNE
jgi:trigger factor